MPLKAANALLKLAAAVSLLNLSRDDVRWQKLMRWVNAPPIL